MWEAKGGSLLTQHMKISTQLALRK
ncbi:hypothetical protein MTR67_051033 [Solanum verrucosum]|uniref:Uncharacterized protein n=1 Tax=Solanum verrucosum TaxID=315347 RepID=A0AAF1A1R4_SOLVR|nr:hypothetical protein MTR67_051033 [Solanum verrucosum]